MLFIVINPLYQRVALVYGLMVFNEDQYLPLGRGNRDI